MEIFIERHLMKNKVEVYLKEQRGREDAFMHYDGENLVLKTIDPTDPTVQDIKPFMVLPMNYFQAIVTAFTNEGKKMGISTENENLLRGKLEATELHLNDMREFSKKLLDKDLTVSS